ncbi:hypothetical protein T01_9557 [Trichinella spiralis]|uniref:Uncharacterized protein n=1 Tax=Trichinella spiralis TaxID=6334 RepID=A0A0V1B0L8_TRISP|nr:hypothetical protein T01_9557 [Trichinella spiralis]
MVHHNFRLDTKEASLNLVKIYFDVEIFYLISCCFFDCASTVAKLDGVLQNQNERRFQRKPGRHHHLYSIWPITLCNDVQPSVKCGFAMNSALKHPVAMVIQVGIKEFEMKYLDLFLIAVAYSCCTHTATVVDLVGIRAITCFTFTEFQILDEIAFFDNYALLNIRLLLFNSYQFIFDPDSQIQVNATWLNVYITKINLHLYKCYVVVISVQNFARGVA